MPENEFPKLVPHPIRRECMGGGKPVPDRAVPHARPRNTAAEALAGPGGFAELCVTTNYTFLTGASHPEEFVYAAALLGYQAIAVTDLHTVAGIVRAHVAAKETGLQFIVGTRVKLTDVPGVSVCLYPTDMASYRRMCRLLTTGKRRAEKGSCTLHWADLEALHEGLLAVALPEEWEAPETCREGVRRLAQLFGDDRLSLGLCARYGADDAGVLRGLATIARELDVPVAATSDALYHEPERRLLQDVLTCIRHGCTLREAGLKLEANAERHLKPAEEMARLLAEYPDSLRRTMQIAERTRGFTLDQLKYEYPDEVVPAGKQPLEHLADLTWKGARERYPGGVPEKVRTQIEHELVLIGELDYARYFLTVHDLVCFARSKGILCQGRGAAANSAVCFCLGVTSVDPGRIDLLFERFVSKERNEPPDIDIDFEHERREIVIQYLYAKYGRERAALTAEVITYRYRSAVRDVGKALGLSLDLVDRLAKDVDWWDAKVMTSARVAEHGLNPSDPTLRWLAKLVGEILGFPRHLSQHVGGFVISRGPLCELVPIENAAMQDRTVIEWDKDDIDALGMLKVDVLGLGMLTCLEKCLRLVNRRRGAGLPGGPEPFELHTLPPEDPATYEMIQRADTLGVFQIESRAQMSMLPRLKPACFYDLVIEVAIVRPGPIQGDMVHPYLRRRNGEEKVEYVHDSVREVLGKTLGVPLFQEQCMALAVKAAGFSPGEADALRRAMAAWKRKGNLIVRFGEKLIEGMVKKGIPREFAVRCFEQVKGFSEYGFPESHAASFALLVYASCYLKRHYPAEFAAALLNSQPMGFYAPAQIVRDAREHGVVVRPVDVNRSGWDCDVEPDGSLRLGLRRVTGLAEADARLIERAVREHGPFASLATLWRRSGARVGGLRRLAHADAFGSMGLSRQQALWQARALRDEPLPLFEPVPEAGEDPPTLPRLSLRRHVVLDYNATGLSLKSHPMAFARARLSERGVTRCGELKNPDVTPEGEWVKIAGLVLVRQRPGTAQGVTFITLEDETGTANLIVWRNTFERYRREASAGMIVVAGRVQRQGLVVHVVVEKVRGLDAWLDGMSVAARNFH